MLDERQMHGELVLMEPQLMEPSEAAVLLFGNKNRTLVQRVRRMCKAGELRHVKDGRNYWIFREQLKRGDNERD